MFSAINFSFILSFCLLIIYLINRTFKNDQRSIVLMFTIGFFIINVYGLSYTNVQYNLICKFYVFILVVIATFYCCTKLFGTHPQKAFNFDNNLFLRGAWINRFFWIHLIVIFSYLFYPNFILLKLFRPDAPDLTYFLDGNTEEFYSGYGQFNVLRDIVKYLTFPFFFYFLYSFKDKPVVVFFLLTFPTYVSYVFGYVSRADIFIPLLIYLIYLRKYYRRLYRVILMTFPFFIYSILSFLLYYSYSRIGLGDLDVSLDEFFISFINTEFGFIQTTVIPLIESAKSVDLVSYQTWLWTLPLPKSLFFSHSFYPQINFEVSSIITGLPPNSKGWYVLLPGLLGESIYIYGPYFFFLHSIYLGVVIYLVYKLLSGFESLVFLKYYVFVYTMYNLNRAGVGSYLPFIVNSMLLFHLFVLGKLISRRHVRNKVA